MKNIKKIFIDKIVSDLDNDIISAKYSNDNIETIENGKLYLNFNCSGFINYYLKNIDREDAIKEIETFIRKNLNVEDFDLLPMMTNDYHLFFKTLKRASSKYWEKLESPSQLNIGDIIVYINDTQDDKQRKHMMIVKDIINNAYDEIEISVLDSTQYPHSEDSRNNKNGAGYGKITLYKGDDNYWNTIKYRENKIINRNVIYFRIK